LGSRARCNGRRTGGFGYLDIWIPKNFRSKKSDYQKVDKLKVYFGDLVNILNPKTKHNNNLNNNFELIIKIKNNSTLLILIYNFTVKINQK
jgi:hypothetical protein